MPKLIVSKLRVRSRLNGELLTNNSAQNWCYEIMSFADFVFRQIHAGRGIFPVVCLFRLQLSLTTS